MSDALVHAMTKPTHIATTYEEIVHNTVPELDMFQSPSPSPITDGELESRVQASLRTDSTLAEAQIDVRVHDSHVWLTGTVIGPGVAAYAADVAKRVAGVVEVHNEIAISYA